jgi:hypothetical protein
MEFTGKAGGLPRYWLPAEEFNSPALSPLLSLHPIKSIAPIIDPTFIILKTPFVKLRVRGQTDLTEILLTQQWWQASQLVTMDKEYLD